MSERSSAPLGEDLVRREGRRFTRRGALAVSSAAVAGVMLTADHAVRADDRPLACTLGFSTYGMKSLRTEQAVEAVAATGFDAIEMAVRSDWDAAPTRMPPQRRKVIRQLLDTRGLVLTSLMEHIMPSADDGEHASHLARLRQVFELGRDITPGPMPLVQTVLGGGVWEQKRNLLRDRLGDWLELAQEHETVLAIKPHRGGAVSRPSEAAWLIKQLGHSNWLRMVYDYSHYAFRDMRLGETIRAALPITSHIAVKDAVQIDGRIVFQLPGEAGSIDYVELLKQFYAGGYRGDVSCEVSGMVWSKPGYDPIASAQHSYSVMSKAFREAGVPRPAGSS